MADTKFDVPIWHKTNLTVEEAAAYSGIGSQKLREMSDSEYCPFVLWNGAKRLIKLEKWTIQERQSVRVLMCQYGIKQT